MNFLKMNRDDFMNLNKFENISFLSFSIFKNKPLIAAVSTRSGGVSSGRFSSLNMKFLEGEKSENVVENRKRFLKVFDISYKNIIACDQVHGTEIKTVTGKDKGKGALSPNSCFHGYDGLITNELNVPLTMCFADCTPIFLYDEVNNVIALCHAGWRGTVGNITGKAVDIMKTDFGTNPENIVAGIGPAIGQDSFEVGKEVYEEFLKIFDKNEMNLISYEGNNGKYFINLEKANELLLVKSKVNSKNIECVDFCTKAHSDILYSYRKDNGKTGRHMAVFMLKNR